APRRLRRHRSVLLHAQQLGGGAHVFRRARPPGSEREADRRQRRRTLHDHTLADGEPRARDDRAPRAGYRAAIGRTTRVLNGSIDERERLDQRGGTMERRVFNEEHELFREQFKKFCEREVTPNVERWEEQRIVDRETWKKAGDQGFLCPTLAPKYGGSG